MKKENALIGRCRSWLGTEPKLRYLVLAFFLPVIILGTVFALHGVYPFGGQQILVTDFWHQYYPFFSDFWHKIRQSSSLLWSWGNGLGTNYLALMAYYLASPLNFLVALFPHGWLREVITVFLLIKIGLAGSFFAAYLKYSFQRNDLSLSLFSLFYALCAFTLGYYWNIMWFDTFALLPLVILGLQALVREGKYKTYIISLGLSFLFNFYIGFFTCLFVALMFFLFCLVYGVRGKQFLQKLLHIAVYSIVALGLGTFLVLPTFYSLSNAYSSAGTFPAAAKLYENFLDIIGNFIAFALPTAKEGLPNIYGGMLSVLLLGVFAFSPQIKVRERVSYIGLLIFLIVSCNVNMLNYIWHGFRFSNMLPYRFSFLISFLLIVMGYRAFLLLDTYDKRAYVGMGLTALWTLFAAYIGPQEDLSVLAAAVLTVCYILLLFLYGRKKLSQRLFAGILSFLILAEVCGNTFVGVNTVSTTSRTDYPPAYDEVRQLLAERTAGSGEHSRTEFAAWYTLNTPSLYGYDGVTFFSSTVNAATTNFLEGLGLAAWKSGNRYTYGETSPLTNGFLNLKYMIAHEGKYMDKSHWRQAGKDGAAILLENQYYLPFGFMVKEAITDFATEDNTNPFLAQNRLFTMATGIDEELFTPVDIIHVGHTDLKANRQSYGKYSYTVQTEAKGTFKFNYEMPKDGVLYAYAVISDDEDIQILKNNEEVYSVNRKRPYIFCCGPYKQGEIMSLKTGAPASRTSGTVQVYVNMLNQEVFDKGYAVLRDEGLVLTEFSGTKVAGRILAKEQGMLYTSLPYEEGWQAYVDGKETAILPLNGSMAMVPLTAGEHEIVFRFLPPGLKLGLGLSALSLLAFCLLLYLDRPRQKRGLPPL